MRRTKTKFSYISVAIMLGLTIFSQSFSVLVDAADEPSLIISQLKITSSNGQFITLFNATDTTLDMSMYQLEYFNNYDLSKATSSRHIALSGTLPPHGYYMVNDSSLLLCYQLTIDSQSLGLSSTAGMVQVVSYNQSSIGSAVVKSLQDYVGWSKSNTSYAQVLPTSTSSFLNRLPIDKDNNPVISAPGLGSWQAVQPDVSNPCRLLTASGVQTPVPTGISQLLPPSEPPAIISNISPDESSSEVAVIPAADIGLMSPQVNELLPNPNGTGTDETDEFIELYNPNSKPFDLSGFYLQTGLTTLKKYKFPSGTLLQPKSFKAFFSEETGLSLSNTSSQAKLLDPFGNSISISSIYSKAKDGQTWSLAKGKWYWSTQSTPNAVNNIKQPLPAKKTSNSKSNKSAGASKSSQSTGNSSIDDKPAAAPIHLWALALIAGLALLYGVYEYRTDLGNRIYQLRRYIKNRRPNRSEA